MTLFPSKPPKPPWCSQITNLSTDHTPCPPLMDLQDEIQPEWKAWEGNACPPENQLFLHVVLTQKGFHGSTACLGSPGLWAPKIQPLLPQTEVQKGK